MKFLNQSGEVVRINQSQELGDGHEAIVYGLSDREVAKIYRAPSWYEDPAERTLATRRLKHHQEKLLAFPTDLPEHAVGPTDVLWNYSSFLGIKRRKEVVGYIMPRVNDAQEIDYYMSPISRDEGVTDTTVVKALINLHEVISGIHEKGLVIGDLNHGNVLVRRAEAWAIDLDAGQFDDYVCRTWDPDYLDPRLMDTNPDLLEPLLAEDQFYTASSDWYSFCVMVLACLTYTKPYMGTYRDQAICDVQRPLQRLSIFHPKVQFPKIGVARQPEKILSESLLQYLKRVFTEEDMRGPFPVWLLESLLPGASHKGEIKIRSKPDYRWPSVIESVQQPNKRSLDLLLQTRGTIDPISRIQEETLRYMISNAGTYTRDHGYPVIEGETSEDYRKVGRYRFHYLHGEHTVTVHEGEATLHKPRLAPETFRVDSFGEVPAIASNGDIMAWYHDRMLYMAYDDIEEKIALQESPFDTNMVWVTDQGTIVSYHRSGEDVEMTMHTQSDVHILKTTFDDNRPQNMRIFEDKSGLKIFSWHDGVVHVHCYKADGTFTHHMALDENFTFEPRMIAQDKMGYIFLDTKGTLRRLVLEGKRFISDTIQKLDMKSVTDVLGHPRGGLAVFVTDNQIWQLK